MDKIKYIVAVEIGSSKISGALGRVRPSSPDKLEVLAVETERATEIVRHGLIQNVEEVGNRVSSIVSRLEKRLNTSGRKARISAVYVGLAGRSLRNILIETQRNLPDDTEITERIIADLHDDALHYNIDSSLEVVHAVPRSYLVNRNETRNPVGICGNSITAKYNLIACRPMLRRHLNRVITMKAGLNIADTVVVPVALADLVLSADEKRLGCMLVDLGAETTTVSIYKDNTLVYLSVLPMGSRNITTDITSLSVLEDRAEEIKTTSGSAIQSENEPTLNLSGVKLSDVANLVAARSEELVANIVEQIRYAGLTERQLPGGVVMAGAGFELKRLPELLEDRSGLKVRRSSLPQNVAVEDTKASAYESLQLIAVMAAGTAAGKPGSVEIEEVSELPASGEYVPEPEPEKTQRRRRDRDPEEGPEGTRRGGIWGRLGKIKDGIAGIFTPGDDEEDTDLS